MLLVTRGGNHEGRTRRWDERGSQAGLPCLTPSELDVGRRSRAPSAHASRSRALRCWAWCSASRVRERKHVRRNSRSVSARPQQSAAASATEARLAETRASAGSSRVTRGRAALAMRRSFVWSSVAWAPRRVHCDRAAPAICAQESPFIE
jgi:hypothetical protein